MKQGTTICNHGTPTDQKCLVCSIEFAEKMYRIETEKQLSDLQAKCRDYETALTLAVNAFSNNWAIDWNELEEVLLKHRR